MDPSESPADAAEETPQIDITKKPGRAFLHKLTGKFLAESGIKRFWTTKKYMYESELLLRRRNLKMQLYFYGYACRPL